MLLDEPTAHLDFRNQVLVLRLLRELAESGLAILMTSHAPNHALSVADRVGMIHAGGLLALGSPSSVITEHTLKRTYGIDVRIYSARDPADGSQVHFCHPVATNNGEER